MVNEILIALKQPNSVNSERAATRAQRRMSPTAHWALTPRKATAPAQNSHTEPQAGD